MALEGTVEVEDIEKTRIEPMMPETERILRMQAIEAPKPIESEKRPEVEELENLPVPGRSRDLRHLEENLSLMMIAGPGRVKEYLENPKIFTRKDYPVLTQKIAEARRLMVEADQKDALEIYERAIRDLENFTEQYLDPFGRFRPQIQFFIGAVQYSRGKSEEALRMFESVTKSPDSSWKARAHLARALIYEEILKDPDQARQEYRAVLETAPGSPEAEEARRYI